MAMAVGAAAQAPAPPDSAALETLPYMESENPRQYIIRDVVVHSSGHTNPELLVSMSGLVRGDTVWMPGEFLTDVTRRFWSMNQFSDVKTVVQTQVDSAWVHIYLTQLPLVPSWSFEGIRRGEREDLLEKLAIRRNLPLTDFRVKTYTDQIREFYTEKGYRNAAIDLRVQNDTTRQNSVLATFVIDKGPKVKIAKIDFAGNAAFSDGRLRRTFKKTHRTGINLAFFRSKKLNEEEYATDKDLLVDFYNSRGFRDAAILSDSIYPINDKRIGISLQVEEGHTFYYRNVTWMGNSVYPTEQLNSMLAITKGQMYDRKSMDRQLGIRNEADPMRTSVSTLYTNNGYLMSNIEAQEIVVGGDSIDLQIKILEGKPFTVNQITITGNTRVYDHAIRRELEVRPGDLYNQQMLVSTIQRLGQMQHFNPESTTAPRIMPVSDDLVDLGFSLEEVASDQFEVSGGWGAGMFVGSVGVTLTNFNLKNLLKGSEWRPYPHGENQQLSLRGQSNGQYYKALSLSFTDPWFGGKKPNSLTVGLYYSDQTDAYFITQRSNKHFRTMGASLGVGRRLQWPDYMFSLYNEVMYQAYNLQDWDGFGLGFTNGTANIIALNTVLSRNTVSNMYFPSDGSTLSLSVSLTPPYSLWDGKDYTPGSGLSEQDRNRWIEYHKWSFSGDWYLPLSTNQKFALRLHAEAGLVGSYNKNKQSPFEGYEVGGDGMSGYSLYGVDVVGLRGYENGSITNPYINQSKAYNKYSVEMRYLVLQQGQTMAYALAFAEGGNAFDHVRNFDPFLLKRSIGVGVRLHLPMLGWIGIDYGYGFDHDATGRKGGGNPHFMIGQNF